VQCPAVVHEGVTPHCCVLLIAGGMLEEHKRASVPTAMYCLLAAYCLEAAALTYTTVVFESLVTDTDACYTAEELARYVCLCLGRSVLLCPTCNRGTCSLLCGAFCCLQGSGLWCS
jgi:hypothetical protein